jgi:hypothetical protein
MNAGLLKVTCTVFTETVMPSITLLIKLYFALPPYDDRPCCVDIERSSSHVSTCMCTSSKLCEHDENNHSEREIPMVVHIIRLRKRYQQISAHKYISACKYSAYRYKRSFIKKEGVFFYVHIFI